MTKYDAIQVYQTYLFVVRDWIDFFKRSENAFIKEKNDVFFRRLESSLGMAENEFLAILELSDRSWEAIKSKEESIIQGMSDFICNYPPPEEKKE